MRVEHSPARDAPSQRWVATPIKQRQSSLDPYVEAIRGHTLLILLVLGAVVVASLAWLTFRAPEYKADAEIFVTPLPGETVALVGLPLLQDLREPTRTIQTAAALVDSHAAAARTAKVLGGNWTRERVERATSVAPQGETNILEVSAVAGEAELAARLANVYSTSALEVRRVQLQKLAQARLPVVRARLDGLNPDTASAAELESALNKLEAIARGQDPTLSLAQAATTPTSSEGVSALVILVLAVLAGGVIGIATALAIDRITPPRVTSEEELVGVFPLPILARLPILPRQHRDALSLDIDPESREALRSLQVQLDLEGATPKTVMITSPSPSDGKTTTSLAFAVAVADAGSQVILIDTDVRRRPIRSGLESDAEAPAQVAPRLHRRPSAGPATAEVKLSLRPLLRRVVGHPNLQLLDAMDVGFDTADPYARGRLADLARAAAQEADYVILDTPPIGVISDALTLMELVDHVLIVAKIRSTKRLHVEVARDLLSRAGVTPDGYLVIGERTLGSYPYPIAR